MEWVGPYRFYHKFPPPASWQTASVPSRRAAAGSAPRPRGVPNGGGQPRSRIARRPCPWSPIFPTSRISTRFTKWKRRLICEFQEQLEWEREDFARSFQGNSHIRQVTDSGFCVAVSAPPLQSILRTFNAYLAF